MNTIKENVIPAIVLLATCWIVFALDTIGLIPKLGIVPRDTFGAIGILTSPIMHGSLKHIISNSIPFLSLMVLFSFVHNTDKKSWVIPFALIWIGSGVLVWLIGRSANHVGMSGVIFGLWAYLIVYGALRRNVVAIIGAVITLFVYGGLFVSLLDFNQPGVSIEGHLFGALIGGLIAKGTAKQT